MKKYLSLFLVITFTMLSAKIIAQSNYQEGYIISFDNDTSYGYIDYRQWDKNPVEIKFQSDSLAEPVKYTPMEIKAFTVGGDHYLGGIFEIDKCPYLIEDLTTENKAKSDVDTVFLTILVDGTLSLFYMKDENAKEHFFISNNDSGISELIYRRYLLIDENHSGIESRTNVAEYNLYKGMLIHYTKEVPGFINKINATPLKLTALTKLVDEYNKKSGCASEYCRVNKFKTKWIKSFHVISGISYSYYDLNKLAGDNENVVQSDPNPGFVWFTTGIGLNIMPPRKLQRFALYYEILYHAHKYSYNYQVEERQNLNHFYHYELDAHYLKFSFLPRYQPRFKKVRPYINAGITTSIPVWGYYKGYKETHFWDQVTREEYQGFVPQVGLDAGIGLYYKKFNFDVRFSPFSGYRLFLMISYRLKASDTPPKVLM